MTNVSKFLGVLLLTFLSACSDVILLEEQTQADTNEVLVLLYKNGINAKKEAVAKQQSTSWKVTVSASDEQRARELLVANNLPRPRQGGLSGICQETVMIPTPKIEKCRELLAMKGEIINSLTSIAGVVKADVVLNIPDKEDFPDEAAPVQRPTASVVLQLAAGTVIGQGVFTETNLQRFVSNAVTGMDPRDVVVMMNVPIAPKILDSEPAPQTAQVEETIEPISEDEAVAVGGLVMDAESAKKFKAVAVIVLGCFVVLSAGLIFALFKLARNRQRQGFGMIPSDKPALPEKAAMDDLIEETGQTERV